MISPASTAVAIRYQGVLQMEEVEIPADRRADLAHRRAPLPERVLLDHERDAERGQDGRQRITADQRPQRRDLQQGAEDGDDDHRDDQRQPVAAGDTQHAGADEGAEHQQIAVREVDDVHDAEDEREPRGDHRQDHAVHEAVKGLDDDLVHLRPPGTRG
jgi:hypothetical protein